jgi:peptide/nickel transport system permease protein
MYSKLTRKITQADTPFTRFLQGFFSSRIATFGFILLLLILLAAIFAPIISPQNPYDLQQINVMDSRLEPGKTAMEGNLTFLLGTEIRAATCCRRFSTACAFRLWSASPVP